MSKVIWFSSILLLAASCSTVKVHGPDFSPHQSQSEENAIIYVYRKPSETFGWARKYYLVNSESTQKVTLMHGGYYPLEVQPGKVRLAADRSSSLTLETAKKIIEINTEKGASYYVSLLPIPYDWDFVIKLAHVRDDVGSYEIQQCKLISEDD